MIVRRRQLQTAFIALAIALLAGTAQAQLHYVEEFNSTTFLDPENTTAHWNTAGGVLEFPEFDTTVLGSANTPSAARGIHIHGNLAYVADGYSGVQIVDITDPSAPVIIGSYNTSGYAYQVQVVGHYAFVADWEHGLDILNVQYPNSPVLVSNVPTANANLGLVVKGDLVYIADGGGGLRIVDASNIGLPEVIGTASVGAGSRLDVAGDLAYLACQELGLLIFDVSDPTDPTQIGAFNTPGAASDVVVAGTHAFVADNDGGLQVLDISDPTNPTLVGAWVSDGETRGLTVDGHWVYLANGGLGVRVLDVADPTNPILHDTLGLPGSCYDIAVDGEIIYTTQFNNGLYAVRAAVIPTLGVQDEGYDTPGDVLDVVVSGDIAYLADGIGGFTILDISDPASPSIRDRIYTGTIGHAIAVDGDLALMLAAGGGLYSYNIVDPDFIDFLSVDLTFTGEDIVIDGNYAYVADLIEGLRILDVSNPTQISEVGTLPLTGTPNRLAVDGDQVFVVCGPVGLVTIDVTDPTSPTLLNTYAGGSVITDVAIAGDHAYLADFEDEIIVLDITDPDAMVEVGRRSHVFYGGASEIVVSGETAYIFSSFNGGLKIDISDPTDPETAGSFATNYEDISGAAIAGDHLYMAEGNFSVMVLRERRIAYQSDQAVSLTYPTSGRDIIRFRVSSSQTGGADFRAFGSCQGPDFFTPLSDIWTRNLYSYCGDLGFIAYLDWRQQTVIDWVDLQWLEDSSVIHTINDVPDDQGGRVLIDIVRSGYDFADEVEHPVTQYGVWRRVDDADEAHKASQSTPDDQILPGASTTEFDGTRYVTGSRGTFPPGTWALVSTIPALQQDHYLAEVPTVADSTDAGITWTAFVVTTHTTTPSDWYVTLPDSSYSTDDLAPTMPTNLLADYQNDGVDLGWDDAPEHDFRTFRIYRGTSPDFMPSDENLIHETAGSSWTDATFEPWNFHYKVASVDHAGNLSEAAAIGGVVGVPDSARTFALREAVPNPFNPSTTIRYTIPTAGKVELVVYDLSGRTVSRLVSEHQAAGEHSVRWHGEDRAGNRMASGVYLYRLVADGFSETRRMTLVK